MDHTELIKAIDDDINKHHLKASEMLGVMWALFFVIGLIFIIYIAPSIAERALPELEKNALLERSEFDNLVSRYESLYKKQYIPISADEYKKLIETGNTSDDTKAARQISKTSENINSSSSLHRSAKIVAMFKVEDSKIESILKILPYAIGAILAGILVTYRLHIVSAKELALKKFEILSQNLASKASETESTESNKNS